MPTQSPFVDPSQGQDSQNPEVIIGVCPACQQAVKHTADQMLRSRGDMTLAYGACLSCNTPVFTLMVGRGVVHTSVGVSTDLTQPEIEKFWSARALSENDMLALHELLSTPRSTNYFTHKG
jgi:hypothetical protein